VTAALCKQGSKQVYSRPVIAGLSSGKCYSQSSSSPDSSSSPVSAPSSPDDKGSGAKKTSKGFADALAKFEGHVSFPKMLRYSPFVQMGDPQGKIVEGKIVHIVNDDLYIDFGFKFNCVCPRPSKNGEAYILGRSVRLLVHDLELSTRFLGSKTDLTILEADCTLLGLVGKRTMSLGSPVEEGSEPTTTEQLQLPTSKMAVT